MNDIEMCSCGHSRASHFWDEGPCAIAMCECHRCDVDDVDLATVQAVEPGPLFMRYWPSDDGDVLLDEDGVPEQAPLFMRTWSGSYVQIEYDGWPALELLFRVVLGHVRHKMSTWKARWRAWWR